MFDAKKLTQALYSAAEKAGMRDALASAQVEVVVSEGVASLSWEHELRERESFVFPKATFERAKAWLAKATKGAGR